MFKKISATLLVVILVFVLLGSVLMIDATATLQNMNSSYYTVDGVKFENRVKNDGTWFYRPYYDGVIIVAYKGDDTEVRIPEKIGDSDVVAIEIWGESLRGRGTKGFPAFDNKIETLIIPKTVEEFVNDDYVTYANPMRSDLNSLKQYIVDENNKYFSSEDDVLYNKDKTTLISYPCKKEDREYTIPESVTCIMDDAFFRVGKAYGNDNLKKVTVTKNVEEIILETHGSMYDWTFDTVVFDNVILDKEELIFWGAKEIVVYENSSIHKQYKKRLEGYNGHDVPKLTLVDNPYIEKQDNTESKDTTSKKDTVKDNSSKSESVVSKPTESAITETAESGEDLTIGAAENNVDNTTEAKPEKSNKIWVIVVIAAAVLLAGGTAYWFISKKKKA